MRWQEVDMRQTAAERFLIFKSNSDRTVTAADIDQYLKRNGDAVNITTIYRYLDKLATDGTVMKICGGGGRKGSVSVRGTGTALRGASSSEMCQMWMHHSSRLRIYG